MQEHAERYYTWLNDVKRVSPHTLQAYRRDINAFLIFCSDSGACSIDAVSSADIRAFISQLHRKGIAPASIKRKLSSVRSWFTYLGEQRGCKHNPAVGVAAPKQARKLPRTMDVDQLGGLLDQSVETPIDIRDWAMMEVLYGAGLRLAELASMNIEDIDLKSSLVNVTGKGNKQRILPMGKAAVNAVQRWLTVRSTMVSDAENAVFVSSRGQRLSHRAIQQRIKLIGDKFLRQKVHPHMLRHSFASHMLESSGDLRAVQEMLGHENLSTTQVYTHLDYQHLAKVYDQSHPRAQRKPSEDEATGTK